MNQKKAGLILMVVMIMSAVMAPAAQASTIVEYAIVLPIIKVDTNIGPAWFTARSNGDGIVTAILKIVETSEAYRLYLDKLDAYILDFWTKERVGVRLTGQATTPDGEAADATVIVSNSRNGEGIVVIVAMQFLSPTISKEIEFETTEGTLTIGTQYSATDPLVEARIDPQMVDADGDGYRAELVWGRWSVSADGTAMGRTVVSHDDDARMSFYPKRGDLFCTNGQLMLELNGPVFTRHPDGSIEFLGDGTATAEPDTTYSEDPLTGFHFEIDIGGKFDTRGEMELNVNSCP
jgi:hypothetical protein